MNIDLQPTNLGNEYVRLSPLKTDDFEKLYKAASDPLIWEQHPNPNRYKREVFQTFFEGAIASKGAFLVFDANTNGVIGSSRYHDFNKDMNQIEIGYTFLARDHWGTTYNRALKRLMLEHIFKYVDNVVFHIGANNIRSQKAIEKLGAKKTGEIEMEYYGEGKKLNFMYQITKEMLYPG